MSVNNKYRKQVEFIEKYRDAINAASTTATFDSTDATFTNLTEVVKTEVDSILPILPIKYIRPVNVNDDSTLTNQQWDFDIDMNEGDSDFISRIKTIIALISNIIKKSCRIYVRESELPVLQQ